jgi:hypothetical protein
MGDPQATQYVLAVTVGRYAEGDVGGLGEKTDLVGEYFRKSVPVGDAGNRGNIGGQRNCRQRALSGDHRVRELDGDMLRVGARPAIAEDNEFSTLVKSIRHGVAGFRDRSRIAGQRLGGRYPAIEQCGYGVHRGGRPRHCGSLPHVVEQRK